jgi:glycosyltransferase involved in cell wall biosynthesis
LPAFTAADRLRVAMDVTPLLGFRTGIGLSVQEMWAALSARASDPALTPYVLGLRSPTRAPGLPEGVRSVRLPTRALLTAWARMDHPRLDHWLREADVVHATNFITGPSRRPTLTTVNDIGFVLDPSSADPVVAKFPAVLRRALARGAHVHVTTHQVGTEVDEHFGPGLLAAERITVIPFGVPALGSPGPLPPALSDFLSAGTYVLAIGKAERRKNFPLLVRAFGQVAPEHPRLRLVVAGPQGPDSAELRAAIDALPDSVAARVRLAGPVSGPVRRTLLDGALVLAYPSRYEGFGFPPLEAMQAGVPVLASRVGAVQEVAGPAAALAAPEEVNEWAAALERLVVDPEHRAALIDAGRRHVAAFSWQATAAELAALYRRLANSS